MLYREIISVCAEIHTKHINALRVRVCVCVCVCVRERERERERERGCRIFNIKAGSTYIQALWFTQVILYFILPVMK